MGVTVVAGTVGNIIFNSILVPTYGAYGAAIATVIGFIIEWTISYIFALKVVDLSISLKKIIMLFILIGIECALTVLGKAQIMYVAGDILIISLIVVLVRKEMLEIIKKLISIFKGKMNVLKR